MHVGVVVVVVVNHRLYNYLWLLRTGTIIKVDKRFAIDLLVQNFEVLTHGVDVKRPLCLWLQVATTVH